MKKVLLFTSLCLCTNFMFAQKKAVNEAKKAKTEEARKLISPALTDPETKDDAETWFVAGNIEFKSFEQQYDAELTKELTNGAGGNPEIMYTGIYNMIPYYTKADELGELPDAKGKIKNKYRKDIAKNIKVAYPYFINGGIYYNDEAKKNLDSGNETKAKELYKKATDFFEYYWDIPSLSIFSNDNIEISESAPIIKYYSAICAIQSEDNDRSVGLLKRLMNEPYVENDTYKEDDIYELLAEAYKKANDSIKYIESLKIGSEKFPDNSYFTPNLINEYLKSGEYDAAISYLDQAVKNDPSNACDFLSVKANLLADKKDYDSAIENYQAILSNSPQCERAIYGLGLVYILQAEEIQNIASQENNKAKLKELDKETIALYEKSIVLLEQYKTIQISKTMENGTFKDNTELKDMKNVLIALQSVYYNLNFLDNQRYEDQYVGVEKLLDELKTFGY